MNQYTAMRELSKAMRELSNAAWVMESKGDSLSAEALDMECEDKWKEFQAMSRQQERDRKKRRIPPDYEI